MQFLTVLFTILAFFQLANAFSLHSSPPAGCIYQSCVKSGSPSACPAGFAHFRNTKCGNFWLKRQEICCPVGGGQPPVPAGGDYQ